MLHISFAISIYTTAALLVLFFFFVLWSSPCSSLPLVTFLHLVIILWTSQCVQCVFRKPNECKERHKILMDRSGDGTDSADDSGSSQPYPSTLPGIPKVLSLPKASKFTFLFWWMTYSMKLILSCMIGCYCCVSCREVPESCFNICKGRWKMILWNLILRKLY